MSHLLSRWRFFAVAAAGATLDLLTKWGAFLYLDTTDEPWSIPGFFDLTKVRNPGSLWGLFSDYPGILTVVTLSIFMVLLVLAVLEWGRTPGMQIALGLFCAGAVGNLHDRLMFGQVRDFLDVHVGTWRWPTFNVADVCICVGAAVFIWTEMRATRRARAEAATEEVA